MTTSLHEIAPRLAAARDIEKWNFWCAGDDSWSGVRDGDRWAEIVGDPRHTTGRCFHCHGIEDRYQFDQRILIGMNRGHVSRIHWRKCRSCRSSYSKHR